MRKQKSTVKNKPKLKKHGKAAVESEETKASVEMKRGELAKTKCRSKAMNQKNK